MNKQKTSKAWRWKVATFLPLFALLLMAFSNKSEQPTVKNILNEKPGVQQSIHDVQNKKQLTLIIKISPEVVEKEIGTLEITQNGKDKSTFNIPVNEKYWLNLDYFTEYSLTFSYPNHIEKTILVSTEVPKESLEKNSNFPAFPMIVNLFRIKIEEERGETSKPIFKIAYLNEVENFGRVPIIGN